MHAKKVEDFVKSIRRLFLHAGFKKEEVVIRRKTEKGPDIIISHTTELGKSIKIILRCKYSPPTKKYHKLDDLIRIYSTFVDEYNADIALLILGGYSIPFEYREINKLEEIRRQRKVVYWDDKSLEYYKKTINTLGAPWARYLILRDLGFQILLQEQPYEVDAIKFVQQPTGQTFYIFSLEPEKLLNISYVFRRGMMDPDAYQRMLTSKRLKDIGKYLSKNDAILANSIIISFDSDVKYEKGKLYIPAKTCSAWIVDGQHRLYGFCKLSNKLDEEERKNILKNFKLPIVAIKAKPKLQAKIFTEINAFQKRINKNLLLDLCDYLDLSIEENILLRVRIIKDLARTPLLRGRIKILPIDKGKITLASIVDYYRYKELVNKFKNRTRSLLFYLFKAVSEVFSDEWKDYETYIFSTNKGVRMLISLLVRIIDYCRRENKRLDYNTIKLILQKLKRACSSDPDYFKIERYRGIALGAGAPDIVARDLWAARIDMLEENFLSEEERNKIGREERKLLKKLEEKLRIFVENKLRDTFGENWWKQGVPHDVRIKAEENKRKNEKPWPWMGKREWPLICYINFTDYSKIILRRDNWRNIFERIFKDKVILEAKLKELEPIRNDIAHNRKLTVEQFEILKLYSSHIIKCIEESK